MAQTTTGDALVQPTDSLVQPTDVNVLPSTTAPGGVRLTVAAASDQQLPAPSVAANAVPLVVPALVSANETLVSSVAFIGPQTGDNEAPTGAALSSVDVDHASLTSSAQQSHTSYSNKAQAGHISAQSDHVPPSAHHHNQMTLPKTPKVRSLASMPSTPQTPTVLDLSVQQQLLQHSHHRQQFQQLDDDDCDSSGLPRFSRMVPGCGTAEQPQPAAHSSAPPPMPTDRVVTGIDNPTAPPLVGASMYTVSGDMPLADGRTSGTVGRTNGTDGRTSGTAGTTDTSASHQQLRSSLAAPPKRSATIGSEDSATFVATSGSHHMAGDGSHHMTGDGSHHMAGDGSHYPTGDGSHHPTGDGSHHSVGDGSHHMAGDGSHHPTGDGSHHAVGDGSHHTAGDGSRMASGGQVASPPSSPVPVNSKPRQLSTTSTSSISPLQSPVMMDDRRYLMHFWKITVKHLPSEHPKNWKLLNTGHF